MTRQFACSASICIGFITVLSDGQFNGDNSYFHKGLDGSVAAQAAENDTAGTESSKVENLPRKMCDCYLDVRAPC